MVQADGGCHNLVQAPPDVFIKSLGFERRPCGGGGDSVEDAVAFGVCGGCSGRGRVLVHRARIASAPWQLSVVKHR